MEGLWLLFVVIEVTPFGWVLGALSVFGALAHRPPAGPGPEPVPQRADPLTCGLAAVALLVNGSIVAAWLLCPWAALFFWVSLAALLASAAAVGLCLRASAF